MEAKVQAAILASSLSTTIKNSRVVISQVSLDALLPVELTAYKAQATLGQLVPTVGSRVHPTELQVHCNVATANQKPVYQMLVE